MIALAFRIVAVGGLIAFLTAAAFLAAWSAVQFSRHTAPYPVTPIVSES